MAAPNSKTSSACGSCATHASQAVPLSISAPRPVSATGAFPSSDFPLPISDSHPPHAPTPSRPADLPPKFYAASLGGPQSRGSVPLIFDPIPEERAAVIRALCDPHQSLEDVALNHNTTIDALSAWMAHPDISARLDAVESAGARNARMSSVNYLPHAANALVDICRAYTHLENKVPLPPNTEARQQRARQAEGTRKAAWLLFRIVRFYAGPPSPRSPGRSAEAPRGDEGRSPNFITTPTPQDAVKLKSLPPLHTVADALAELLARADSLPHSVTSSLRDSVTSSNCATGSPRPEATSATRSTPTPAILVEPASSPDSLPHSVTSSLRDSVTSYSRGAAPASSPGREPRVDRPISPSPSGAPLVPAAVNVISSDSVPSCLRAYVPSHASMPSCDAAAPHPRANAPPVLV